MSKKEISQKIIDYAIWYYLRYFPSINRLKQKLREKFGPESEKGKKYGGIFEDDIEYIISEKMRNILAEEQIIISKINNYIAKGKNISYIKSSLIQKGFKKEEIDKILKQNFNIEKSSILDKNKIFKQITTLYKKGKSKNYIRNKFVENNFDRKLIENILDEIFINGEEELLKNELEKILRKGQGAKYPCGNTEYLEKLDFKEKQKITQKLVGKGFDFGDIIELLNKY